jgi:hypothetical protein
VLAGDAGVFELGPVDVTYALDVGDGAQRQRLLLIRATGVPRPRPPACR